MTRRLTTTAGVPIADNQNALTAGPRGPLLLQDHQLLEKLAHQNRERIPERVVHAKGWGAHCTFTVTHDIRKYTLASVFPARIVQPHHLPLFHRGLLQSPMQMDGFGSHTFSFWNEGEERHWMKFHFRTRQGHDFFTNAETATVIGQIREGDQERLFGAIKEGRFPRWDVKVQIMPEMEAETTPYNPFDLTKVWPHGDYPLIDVGVMELNRNADNYFTEIEQLAVSPSNIVPGIGFSPDKVLQSRIFSYADAHRHRLGTHYESLPVNQPKCPVNHYYQAGSMNSYGIRTGSPDAYYEPSSIEDSPKEDPSVREPPLRISGDAARRNHREGNDDYAQPRALHDLMNDAQRARLYSNTAAAMHGVSDVIIDRVLVHYDRISPAYGAGIRMARADLSGTRQAAE